MSIKIETSSTAEAQWKQHQKQRLANGKKKPAPAPFSQPRDFLENRFVYLTISPRARGLSVGINLNPDAQCNFECLYCDVDHSIPRPDREIDCEVAGHELEQTLGMIYNGNLRRHTPYAALPEDLLVLRHVALSGDGEPTTSPRFRDAVETIVHIRARAKFPFFKIVLITNGSGLDLPGVQAGLALLTSRDEVWVKLDAGTEAYMDLVNRSAVPLKKILENILLTAKKRPVIIQSLFSSVDRIAPSHAEIAAYAQRLQILKEQGANIALVQIYSATRPTATSRVEHLPLRTMSEIASTVRRTTGLRSEVF
jgi:wyosine [tRNA(Phe)-imidazoG37] synthetase (radical SAM superfamily)